VKALFPRRTMPNTGEARLQQKSRIGRAQYGLEKGVQELTYDYSEIRTKLVRDRFRETSFENRDYIDALTGGNLLSSPAGLRWSISASRRRRGRRRKNAGKSDCGINGRSLADCAVGKWRGPLTSLQKAYDIHSITSLHLSCLNRNFHH
jgi:hypothetical protein